MAQIKVRILIPFGEGQKIGDIGYMSKKAAEKTIKEGYVELAETKNKPSTKPIKNQQKPKENIDISFK